jgi:hypothetical protein
MPARMVRWESVESCQLTEAFQEQQELVMSHPNELNRLVEWAMNYESR